eukprot:CAMPEP_0181130566 /NCGR_PEP_ID=MMETSP1071-20121207/29938_1 /TAXON_ID=35127 /ORGANISM="Thalassiosira sp., Strain NH16" /LENGTH=240 /DNA_ID=CAMNT_0023216657 /DNA_START=1091 /DNA_END=1810 /DNA_ORIENTATION=-
MSFTDVSHQGWFAAQSYQTKVNQLLNDKQEKEKIVKEARSKEKIIRMLLEGEYQAASDIYNNMLDKNGSPPESWAEEVSVYVHDHIRDNEQVMIWFPNLPRRPVAADDLSTLNAKKCEADATAAKLKYEALAKCSVFTSQYPLDGGWNIQRKNGQSTGIFVIGHRFTAYGVQYQICMDSKRPKFIWLAPVGSSAAEQTATNAILSGCLLSPTPIRISLKPTIGQTLDWTVSNDEDERIVW